MHVLAPSAIDDRQRCQHMHVLTPSAIDDRREVPTHASKFGVPTIRVKQHTFGATVLGCVWVWHHWKTRKKASLGTCMANKNRNKVIIWRLGWRWLGLSNTLLRQLHSGVCGGGGHEWWRATPMYYYCPRFRACQATRRVVWGRHDSWCATPMCCYCYHWVLLGPSRVSARPIKTKTSSCRESGIKEELLHTGIVLVAAHKLATS